MLDTERVSQVQYLYASQVVWGDFDRNSEFRNQIIWMMVPPIFLIHNSFIKEGAL